MATPRMPAAVLENLFGDPTQHMMAVLLTPATTSIPGTAKVLSDLTSLEIATGGNYIAAAGVWSNTAACQLPDFTINYNDSAGVIEVSAPTSIIVSNAFFTVSFRWVAICSDTKIIAAVDYGTTQTLTSQPLVLTFTESASIAGSYPIMRFTRTTG